jgi:TorA maturation chaperone TorD
VAIATAAWRAFEEAIIKAATSAPLPLATGCLPAPLSYAAYSSFCNTHFTGGLPTSLMPVESLYRPWTLDKDNKAGLYGQTGYYGGDSADQMLELYDRFAIDYKSTDKLEPDHLCLQLEFLSILVEQADHRAVTGFIRQHLSWLPTFTRKLEGIGSDARFFAVISNLLITVLKGMASQEATYSGSAMAVMAAVR